MKTLRLSTISLMLSIILWGTLLGGIAYSHLVYFPVYLSALPDSAVVVNGPYGLHEELFWTLIHPLLILSLVVSLALNWKILLSGLTPDYVYEQGKLDTSLPFEELKKRSRINDAAKAADHAPDFSQQIRAGLPGVNKP